MNYEFEQLRTLAEERLPDAFAPEGDAAFALALDGFALRFASVPGEPALAIVRAKVVDLADADGLARCLDDFSGLIADWRERSALYE